MNIEKILKRTLLGIVLLVLSTISVHAGFGVSPSNIDSAYLKPGSHFEQSFTISRSGTLEEMQITIEPALKEMESWFTFEPGNSFIFKRGDATKEFKIIVNVPSDAKYQGYDGVIRVMAVPTDRSVAGVSITQGVRLDAQLIVTESDHVALSILSISALDTQKSNEIKIDIVGQNIGNVDASPTVKIKIMNLLMETLEEHEITDIGTVKPNETSTLVAQFKSQLPTGEYFVEVGVFLDGKELRRERLVINIENVPDEQPQEEEKDGFFAKIGSIFRGIGDVWPYILIALIIVLLAYFLLEKAWKRKDLEKNANKWWAILLGSRKESRAALSLFFGLGILLILLFFPLVKLSQEDTIRADVDGETQGVQRDNTAGGLLLHVLPRATKYGYLIYKEQDLESEPIYTANDGEEFKVIDETNEWFKVEVNKDITGWLHKTSVRSVTKEDR